MNFLITEAEEGIVLRCFLTDTLHLSHRTLAALKRRDGGILLNGKPVTVRAVLHAWDTLSLCFADSEGEAEESLAPVDIPVEILYEDEHVCVCNKPSGMPTHPSFRHREDTLANALAFRYRDVPYIFRAINRLDKETSGIVLTARTAFSAASLSAAMTRGDIKKKYLAIVSGTPPESGEIHTPIRRRDGSIILREVCEENDTGAEEAHTLFSRIYTNGDFSILDITTLTGRTHQIRVHMASIGHPLLGDGLYGNGEGHPRTALHAYELTFPHPATQEPLTVKADVPPDFASFGERMALGFWNL